MKNKLNIIQKFKFKKIYSIIAAALILITVISAVAFNFVGAHAAGNDPVFETVTVTKQDLRKAISVTGTISSKESYSLTSDLSDVDIKKIYVKVGNRVKKGDLIAELDTSSIEESLKDAEAILKAEEEKNNIEVEAAKRNYELAKQSADAAAIRATVELEKTQTEYNEAVSKSEQLKSEYGGASAYVSEEKNSAEAAKKEVERAKKDSRKMESRIADLQREVEKLEDSDNKAMYNAKKDELAELQKKSEKLKNKLEDKQSKLSDIESDESEAKSKESEKESESKTAEDNLKTSKDAVIKAQQAFEDTARENEKNLAEGLDSIKSSELSAASGSSDTKKEINKYKRQIEKAVITAPADGVITSVSAKEGTMYKGDEIAVLQDDSGYKVRAVVDQYDISDIAVGMNAEMKTETTGEDLMQGVLSFVSPVPEIAENSSKDDSSSSASSSDTDYPIEATIKNPSDRLRIGMKVKLTVIEKEAKDVLTLPNSAIKTDENDNSYVELLEASQSDNDDKAAVTRKVPVKVGLKTDYYSEIESSELKEGSEIINSSDDSDVMEATDEL